MIEIRDEVIRITKAYMTQKQRVSFSVGIKAVPKGRPRFSKGGHAYTPERTREFEEKIRAVGQAKLTNPVAYPVMVTVLIQEVLPESRGGIEQILAELELISPLVGDLDNKVKAITDALNGIAYYDDSQIAMIVSKKVYGLINKITVTIERCGLSAVEIDRLKKTIKGRHEQANRSGGPVG